MQMASMYQNRGYNKAALAFMEAGGDDTVHYSRRSAMDAVVAISPDDKLLLTCTHFA